jgi:glycosyltransferase involved in cell wall biosynthesis
MKRVAFFVTSLNSGGIENYLLRFLQFSKDNIKPFIVCKGGYYGDLESEYKKIKGVELIKMKVGYFNLFHLFKIYKFFTRKKIDTICDFTGNFAGTILFISKLAHIEKRIVFYRASTNHFKESSFRLIYNSIVHKLVKQNATKILSNSNTAFEYFFKERSESDQRFLIIYNGIDSSKFSEKAERATYCEELKLPINHFIIGHVGRYNGAKNHETIAKVANIICEKYTDIYFILLGRDTERFVATAIKNFPKLKGKLIALGYQKKVEAVLKTFDLFFFPSITEGQPNALIEAMVLGLPIIASDINPIKETTPQDFHNKLKNPLDTNGFVKEIELSYTNEDYRRSLILKNWAQQKFDASLLFNQFLEQL